MTYGIISSGIYVPIYRLKREVIAKSWERHALKGEKSVANTDEDSLTMAIESSLNSLRNVDKATVDAVFFASVTAPYAEKSHASMVATVCDLADDVFTADFAYSPKSGTAALKAALDAVAAGSVRQALVTASDCPLAYPKSDQEQLAGDAAAALVIGTENVLAEFKYGYSVNTEILDNWRNYGEVFNHTSEARFASEKGYQTTMGKAIKGLLRKAGLAPADIKKVVLTSPGLRDSAQVAKKAGFELEQLCDPLMMQIGYCATAQPLLLLAAAIETAAPGDYFLIASYGNGADAFLFQATQAIANYKSTQLKKALSTKHYLETYTRYLSFRGLLETVPGEPFRTFPSTAATWRDAKSILKLYGSKCKKCGTIMTPINRICAKCGTKDEYEEICLSGNTAKVFTFSIDNLAGRGDDPTVVQTVCEDEQGTRYYLLMTDFDKNSIKIGMEVEFTFRKVYVGGDFNNYYWKCRPLVEGGNTDVL
jgi:3-hydroxy-3-methylglutaryl CoA synthase